MSDGEMGRFRYTIPQLPAEPLWLVPIKPCAGFRGGEFRVRARDAKEAARRARTYMGFTPTGPAELVEEADDG